MSMEYFKNSNIQDVKKILDSSINGKQFFRYFSKRDINTIAGHLVSKILYISDEPVGYFHIEEEEGLFWFGIIVSDLFVGKGYSKKIINEAIECSDKMKINLRLSVDKNNLIAYNLYIKNNFLLIEEKEKYYIMERKWQTH